MQKGLMIFFFLAAIGLFGWAMNDYASSGEEVLSKPLAGGEGRMTVGPLDHRMSPVRVFLSVDGEIDLINENNDAYIYTISFKDREGQVVLGEKHTHSEKRSDRASGFETFSNNHIIGTAEITRQGHYNLDWKISPMRATLTGYAISIRRNVEGLNVPMVIAAGICFVLGWVTIFLGRRRH